MPTTSQLNTVSADAQMNPRDFSYNLTVFAVMHQYGYNYREAVRAISAAITARAAFERAVVTGEYTGYLK